MRLFAAAAVRPAVRIPPVGSGVAPIAPTIVSPACGRVAPTIRVSPTCSRIAPTVGVLPSRGRVAPVSEATISPGCHERHARIIRTGTASRARNRLRKNGQFFHSKSSFPFGVTISAEGSLRIYFFVLFQQLNILGSLKRLPGDRIDSQVHIRSI